jgi:hypothetical protein
MSDDHLSPTFFVLSTRPPPKPSALDSLASYRAHRAARPETT